MTIDDLTSDNLQIIGSLPNSAELLEYMFITNIPFTVNNLIELSTKEIPKEYIPDGHVSIRKILISPSAIVFLPHEIDLGNRVVREMNSDDFIRINFVDEYNDRNI